MKEIKYFIFLLSIALVCCKDKKVSAVATASGELEFYNELIEESPFVDSLYSLRAAYYYDHGQFKDAIKDLEYAIKLDSSRPQYFHLLADSYLDNNQSFDGLNTMKEAATRFPQRISTLLKLCEFQNILKRYEQSVITAIEILKIDPLNAEAYFMTGINYRDLKDTANAIKSFKKATTYNDKLVDAWILLAQLSYQKEPAYSEKCIETAMRIDSLSVITLNSIAAFYQDKNFEKALTIYRKMILIDPSNTTAYLNAGLLYFSIDSFSRALEHFNIACMKNPTNAQYYYYRGTAREALSDKTGARADYQMAVNLAPDNTEYKTALNQLK
ncbi:MAG: tetratricopeptide repeat protein [Saprospiraceae bacterium]